MEISSDYMFPRLKHLENKGECAPRLCIPLQPLQIAENGASGDRAGGGVKWLLAQRAARLSC